MTEHIHTGKWVCVIVGDLRRGNGFFLCFAFTECCCTSVDGWLLEKDTADVPLGLENAVALCVSCRTGDKMPEEEEEDLKLPQRSKALLRTRLQRTPWIPMLECVSVFGFFQHYHKLWCLVHCGVAVFITCSHCVIYTSNTGLIRSSMNF